MIAESIVTLQIEISRIPWFEFRCFCIKQSVSATCVRERERDCVCNRVGSHSVSGTMRRGNQFLKNEGIHRGLLIMLLIGFY